MDKETKRILQEASVIGRAFLYEILIKITELKDFIDGGLSTLERLDLIRTRALQPDLEYMFKHPLTQEVVYNGVLKKERQEIHEQIALVIESVFQDRLPEFYETLAFHFRQGRSVLKAVDYLIRSGEKCLARYAVDESHQYFKEAYELLSNKSEKTKEENALLIELLTKWSLIRYYRGDLGKYVDLLRSHRDLAESLADRPKLGMFYAWCGWSLWYQGKYTDSYEYLRLALKMGEQIEDQKVIGHACTWLSFTCSELGDLDQAILYGERAQEVCKNRPSDHYLFFKSLGAIGFAFWFKGNCKRTLEEGTALIDYGRKHSNIRSIVMGYWFIGFGHIMKGDFASAISASKKGLQTAQDPLYSQMMRYLLGNCYLANGQLQEAEEALQEVATFSRDVGDESFGPPTHAALGIISISKGLMGKGLNMIEKARQACIKNQRIYALARLEQYLGIVYLRIVDKPAKVNLSTMAKNVGFILKNVPPAAKKAAEHFNRAIEISKEIGAKGVESQAYLDLGRLHKAKGRNDKARDCFTMAIRIFEECEAEVFLQQANEALESLK